VSALGAIAAAAGLRWDGRAHAGVQGGVSVRLEPQGAGVELVLGHPDLPRELWISRRPVPHQGAVLRTGDPAFDASVQVLSPDPTALGWFDAGTRARIRALLVGGDRCSGLRVRLHRERVEPALGAVLAAAVALTAHLARPAPPCAALFDDPEPLVRLAAAERDPDPAVLRALLEVPAARRRAALVFAARAAPGAEPALEAALIEGAGEADAAVLDALGRIGTARALPALAAAARTHGAARRALAAVRARVGGAAGGLSLAADREGAVAVASGPGGLAAPRDERG
jgi:hypothetical protein